MLDLGSIMVVADGGQMAYVAHCGCPWLVINADNPKESLGIDECLIMFDEWLGIIHPLRD